MNNRFSRLGNRGIIRKSRFSTAVPGIVGAWQGYGKTNESKDRDILKDLSGNGRDIQLYNFAFSGMSGYGGYSVDFNILNTSGNGGTVSDKESNKFTITSSTGNEGMSILYTDASISSFKVKVSGLTEGNIQIQSRNSDIYDIVITSDGLYEIPASDTGIQIRSTTKRESCNIVFEQLPLYPGGLVSDGVDDYGQCISQFSLPDDYTVLAVREYPGEWKNLNGTALVQKRASLKEAFYFEGQTQTINVSSYGKGVYFSVSQLPPLFSYQNKGRYNNNELTPGNYPDDSTVPLRLFGKDNYVQAVLYDLRIYDHSLSAEELETVRDEMMSDYEKYAKPLDGINYVADWDAKGRSNDEDADVRNKWIDKTTGKTIDLNNFAYAGMSGWNGYELSFVETFYRMDSADPLTQNYYKCTKGDGNPYMLYRDSGRAIPSFRIRVTGKTAPLSYYYVNEEKVWTSYNIPKDGVYVLPASQSEDHFRTIGFVGRQAGVVIEQLPLYPGALVSDGVDDYGKTQEAINEEVGTVLMHYKQLIESPTQWGYYCDGITTGRIYIAYTEKGAFISNLATKYNDGKIFIGVVKGESALPANNNLYIAVNNSAAEKGQVAIYRLILIREQLDDAQTDFLKWKVEKEYRDWCKANGYEYAINQLTA